MWRWIRNEFGGIAKLIARSDKAFVAAVNGAAAGVGLAFALTCDLILVSERARLVPAFGRIGLVPEVGTSWTLTRRLGYQRTFELFAGGRHLSGAEAADVGPRQRGRRPRPAAARGARVVRADRDAATPRAVDDEAAAPQRRRHDLGAGDRDGGVRRADELHDPRAPRGGRGSARGGVTLRLERRRLAPPQRGTGACWATSAPGCELWNAMRVPHSA